jgi:hypothetical protein
MARSFDSFGVEDWSEWLNAALDGLPADPPVPHSSRELDQDLLGIFRSLSTIPALAFAAAVGNLIRSAPLVNSFARRLSVLLQLAATTKPPVLAVYLDHLLRTETCQQLQLTYGNRDLHSDVLSTLSKYGIDPRLVDYVEDSASRSTDFPYVLNCFRIAVSLNTTAARRIIPFVADLAGSGHALEAIEPRMRQFGVQLLDAALRHQFWEFLQMVLDVSEGETAARVETMAGAVMQSGCLDEVILPATMIAAQRLTATCVRATLGPVGLDAVVEVAKAHSVLGIDVTRRAVHHLWRSALRRDERVMPWDYVSHDEEFLPSRLTKAQDCIFNEGETIDFDADGPAVAILSEISQQSRSQFSKETVVN